MDAGAQHGEQELPKLRQKLRAAVAEYEASVGLNLKVFVCVCLIPSFLCVSVCLYPLAYTIAY